MLESSKQSYLSSNTNVFNKALKVCSIEPMSGYFRNGTCQSNKLDKGNHSVCAIVTDDFLKYTKKRGNDLSSPNIHYGFKGLKSGDKWCLCASRWLEAYNAGIKLDVDLDATHLRALEVIEKKYFKIEDN